MKSGNVFVGCFSGILVAAFPISLTPFSFLQSIYAFLCGINSTLWYNKYDKTKIWRRAGNVHCTTLLSYNYCYNNWYLEESNAAQASPHMSFSCPHLVCLFNGQLWGVSFALPAAILLSWRRLAWGQVQSWRSKGGLQTLQRNKERGDSYPLMRLH